LRDREVVEVELACSGEGMTWNSKELWHIQVIDNRKNLIETNLETMNLRDDSGKLVHNDGSSPAVTNYLECN
jgi:hypothetical protein